MVRKGEVCRNYGGGSFQHKRLLKFGKTPKGFQKKCPLKRNLRRKARFDACTGIVPSYQSAWDSEKCWRNRDEGVIVLIFRGITVDRRDPLDKRRGGKDYCAPYLGGSIRANYFCQER